LGLVGVGIGNGEAIVVVNIHVAQVIDGQTNLLHPLGNRKEGSFVRIARDQDDDPFKQSTATGNDIQVS